MKIYKLEVIRQADGYTVRRITHTGSFEKLCDLVAHFVAELDVFDCHTVCYKSIDYAVIQGDDCRYTFIVSLY